MAMQVGMGLSRIVLLVGAGVTGSIVLRNGRLSEILGEIQEMLQNVEKKGGEGDADVSEALTSQVRRLAMEVRQLSSSRSVTVVHGGGSGQTGITALIIPAATVGVLGYGYMWWKGISFSDLMYVTKRHMADAVSSMTTYLEAVQSSLAAAKKHLTQRIEKLDDKLDQQKAISGEIKDEVTGARLKLDNIGSEIKNIKQLMWGLDDKMDSMEARQNFSCAGVMYLCQFIEGNGGRLPDHLDGLKLNAKRFGDQGSIQGLQHIVQAIESGNYGKDSVGGLLKDSSDSSDKLLRSASLKLRK